MMKINKIKEMYNVNIHIEQNDRVKDYEIVEVS